MTSYNKKRKCHNTLLDRGGEKGKCFKLKRHAMYHKKNRVANKLRLIDVTNKEGNEEEW